MVATRSRLVGLVASVALVAGGLILGGAGPVQAVFGATTFPGANLGAIQDGGSPCGTAPGMVRNVTFNVTGLPSGVLSDVRVTGLTLTHTRVGEVTALLIAPNGSSHVLFSRTGVGSAGTGSGDTSNLGGTYSFADDAPGNWWAAASAADGDTAVPSGAYRTSSTGATATAGGVTSFSTDLSAVTNPNGTWTLRFYDVCAGDTGAVTAATLELAPRCAPYEGAVNTGQAKVASANAAIPTAVAAATAADKAAQDASAAVTKATKRLAKAKKALKSAQESGNAGKVKKATKKLGKAKKALKAAKATRTKAEQNAADAHQKVTSAQAAAIAAQAELIAAQSALAACHSP